MTTEPEAVEESIMAKDDIRAYNEDGVWTLAARDAEWQSFE
ncbi:hypothetical protein [Curtobacterium sp. VKM Ac-2852]|jgi:hypothetical protein|nr:hypothetical protein [Curtobacterium sp. VKM Ac-2852]